MTLSVLFSQRSSPSAHFSWSLDTLAKTWCFGERIAPEQRAAFVRNLILATTHIVSTPCASDRVSFVYEEQSWEVGLRHVGRQVLLSLYRNDHLPEVIVHEHPVDVAHWVHLLSLSLEQAHGAANESGHVSHAELAHARQLLSPLSAITTWERVAQRTVHCIPLKSAAPFALGCHLKLHHVDRVDRWSVERSDLLSLLVRGAFRYAVHGVVREVKDTFVFPLAERLVDLAHEVMNRSGARLPFHRSEYVVGVRISALWKSNTTLRFSMEPQQGWSQSIGSLFPVVDQHVFVTAVIRFARTLLRVLRRHDPNQAYNLRFQALRRNVLTLTALAKQELSLPPEKNNPCPERYEAYAFDRRQELVRTARRSVSSGGGRRTFEPKWTATVPHIDLGATFLRGPRMMVAGRNETTCLDRTTGTILWNIPTRSAHCSATATQLFRWQTNGVLTSIDARTGAKDWQIEMSPGVTEPRTQLLVVAPGLPTLLVMPEQGQFLSAIDGISGQVRWRQRVPSRMATCELQRTGGLLLFASGHHHLTALDACTGEVVWQLRDTVPFTKRSALDGNTLFVPSGSPEHGFRLRAVDAWSGALRWVMGVPAKVRLRGPPLVTPSCVLVLTEAENGVGVMAWDRTTGDLRYEIEPGFVPPRSAWLVLGDMVFINTERGQLLGLDPQTGRLSYRLCLGVHAHEDSSPRHLQPVVHADALFVPQHQVQIVHPQQGQVVGSVATGLVPDRLWVDDVGDVYVAEESGHVAAFAAGPRLRLV